MRFYFIKHRKESITSCQTDLSKHLLLERVENIQTNFETKNNLKVNQLVIKNKYNFFPSFPTGVILSKFPNFRSLEMHLNIHLKYVTKEVYNFLQELEIVEELCLKFIVITSKDNRIFYNSKNLKKLILSRFSFPAEGMPSDIFKMNSKLLILEFYSDEMKINSLPENIFNSLILLKELYLKSIGNLNELPENVFSNLSNLEVLILSDNNIKALPPNVFKMNKNLIVLDLEANQIEILDEKIFQNLTRLKKLLLRKNNLRILPSTIFLNLHALSFLHLNDNKIQEIPKDIFKNNNKLEMITLNGNELRFSKLDFNVFPNHADVIFGVQKPA